MLLQEADRQIQKLYQSLQEQHQGIEGILRLANTMPELIDNINSAMAKLGKNSRLLDIIYFSSLSDTETQIFQDN